MWGPPPSKSFWRTRVLLSNNFGLKYWLSITCNNFQRRAAMVVGSATNIAFLFPESAPEKKKRAKAKKLVSDD